MNSKEKKERKTEVSDCYWGQPHHRQTQKQSESNIYNGTLGEKQEWGVVRVRPCWVSWERGCRPNGMRSPASGCCCGRDGDWGQESPTPCPARSPLWTLVWNEDKAKVLSLCSIQLLGLPKVLWPPLLSPISFQLDWDAFCHASVVQRLLFTTYPPLSTARYQIIQLSGQWQRWVHNLPSNNHRVTSRFSRLSQRMIRSHQLVWPSCSLTLFHSRKTVTTRTLPPVSQK